MALKQSCFLDSFTFTLLQQIVFNDGITEWRPEGQTAEADAFPCSNETLESARAFIDELDAHSKNTSDLTGAVLRAIELDKKVWSSGVMPDNALTTIVLLSDGRSAGGNQQVDIAFSFSG